MQKLNFLLLLLLIGCSSTSPEENVYVVEESKMTISKIKPQLAQPNYKQQRSSSQETTVSYSPSARENVFSLLEHNHRQVKRIYQESIKKEILQEQLVPIKNRKEKSPNIQKLIPLSPRTQKPTQQTLDSKEKRNKDCIKYCGEGYVYDRPGAKNNGEELVCTKYPLKCGYNCTHGWNFRYLVDNTNYTCQEAQQTPDNEKEKEEKKDKDCIKYCGEGFQFSHKDYKNRNFCKLNSQKKLYQHYASSDNPEFICVAPID